MTPKPKIPAYRRQRSASGVRAFVKLNGRRHYLGDYGTPESKQRYEQVIAEWLAGDRHLPTGPEPLLVLEVIDRYWPHVQTHYRKPDGSPTTEQQNIRDALRLLNELYGREPANGFGPLKLKALRQKMIARGWCRTHINRSIDRVKRLFRWAVENELVPAFIYHGLLAVRGLLLGRTEARESRPVQPVSEAVVDATLPFMTPTLRAMVELQRLTGMRPAVPFFSGSEPGSVHVHEHCAVRPGLRWP